MPAFNRYQALMVRALILHAEARETEAQAAMIEPGLDLAHRIAKAAENMDKARMFRTCVERHARLALGLTPYDDLPDFDDVIRASHEVAPVQEA